MKTEKNKSGGEEKIAVAFKFTAANSPFVRRRLRPAANAQFDGLRRRQLRVGVMSGNLGTSQKGERCSQ
jgi:hypothetical protein